MVGADVETWAGDWREIEKPGQPGVDLGRDQHQASMIAQGTDWVLWNDVLSPELKLIAVCLSPNTPD